MYVDDVKAYLQVELVYHMIGDEVWITEALLSSGKNTVDIWNFLDEDVRAMLQEAAYEEEGIDVEEISCYPQHC
jgi:hypothetical protein